jgi:5-methylcytosine-specific restriction endonuclease McrA
MLSSARGRVPLTKALQVAIYDRDGWLCRWCGKPVIFPPVMKYIEIEMRKAGYCGDLAYYHPNWTRAAAPLLDELGAVLDHVEAFAAGGPCAEENLVTSCDKCNARKSSAPLEKWNQRAIRKPIKGKYGEPQHWDGLSGLFTILADRNSEALTTTDRARLKALKQLSATKQGYLPQERGDREPGGSVFLGRRGTPVGALASKLRLGN